MEEIRQIQKKYGSRAMVTAIVAALVLLVMGYKAAGKGLVLGTLFSVLNFVLMAWLLPLRVGASGRKSAALALVGLLLRYLLLAVPLLLAITKEQFSLPAVVGGLFMIQLMILADRLRFGGRSTPQPNS